MNSWLSLVTAFSPVANSSHSRVVASPSWSDRDYGSPHCRERSRIGWITKLCVSAGTQLQRQALPVESAHNELSYACVFTILNSTDHIETDCVEAGFDDTVKAAANTTIIRSTANTGLSGVSVSRPRTASIPRRHRSPYAEKSSSAPITARLYHSPHAAHLRAPPAAASPGSGNELRSPH